MQVNISKSDNKDKKFKATFIKNGSIVKTTHFGASGYSDFTQHKDKERKERYLERHKKNENWNDYKSAASLARYVLWNKPSLKESIEDYKKRFNLK
jgi:hypothetical protein